MGMGVSIKQSPYVKYVTCPGCGSVITVVTELPPEIPEFPWVTLTKKRIYCPECGTDLGISGYGCITYEKITKQTITCPGCGKILELTVSSIDAHNVEQVCPVCGTVAD